MRNVVKVESEEKKLMARARERQSNTRTTREKGRRIALYNKRFLQHFFSSKIYGDFKKKKKKKKKKEKN